MKSFYLFLFILLGAVYPALAIENLNPVEIKEWKIPDSSRSRDPFAENAHSVWFVDQGDHFLKNLNPSTNNIRRWPLTDEPGPHSLIVSSDGIVWYSGNLSGYIGRFDPTSEKIQKIKMPNGSPRDPHTLIFDKSEKHIWFTAQWGNVVGRLTIASRKIDLIPMRTSRARPYGIVIAPDGVVWSALLGTDKLAAIDPHSLKLTEHPVAKGARPRRVDAAPDGRIYYTDYRRGYLGRLDPKSGKLNEWALPGGGDSGPYGMAVDKRGGVWVVETGVSPNTFVGFDPAKNAITSITPIPSGAGSVRHMHYHAGTDTVWFGTDEDTIGRALVGK